MVHTLQDLATATIATHALSSTKSDFETDYLTEIIPHRRAQHVFPGSPFRYGQITFDCEAAPNYE